MHSLLSLLTSVRRGSQGALKKSVSLEREKLLECKKSTTHTITPKPFANRPLFSFPFFISIKHNFSRQVSFAKAASSPTTRATFSSWRRKFKSFDRPLCSVSEFNAKKREKRSKVRVQREREKERERKKKREKKGCNGKTSAAGREYSPECAAAHFSQEAISFGHVSSTFFAFGEGIPPPLPSL